MSLALFLSALLLLSFSSTCHSECQFTFGPWAQWSTTAPCALSQRVREMICPCASCGVPSTSGLIGLRRNECPASTASTSPSTTSSSPSTTVSSSASTTTPVVCSYVFSEWSEWTITCGGLASRTRQQICSGSDICASDPLTFCGAPGDSGLVSLTEQPPCQPVCPTERVCRCKDDAEVAYRTDANGCRVCSCVARATVVASTTTVASTPAPFTRASASTSTASTCPTPRQCNCKRDAISRTYVDPATGCGSCFCEAVDIDTTVATSPSTSTARQTSCPTVRPCNCNPRTSRVVFSVDANGCEICSCLSISISVAGAAVETNTASSSSSSSTSSSMAAIAGSVAGVALLLGIAAFAIVRSHRTSSRLTHLVATSAEVLGDPRVSDV